MTRILAIGVALGMTAAAPLAMAQQRAAAAPIPDQARVVAARKLIDLVLPPGRRDAMLDAIIRPMMTNVQQAITQSPEFQSASDDPRVAKLVEQYLAQQQENSLADLKANMPEMLDAMAKAYARRFTTAQLADLATFFNTPTGRVYVEQAPTVMSDPDVLAWQRTLLTRSMARVQADAKTLAAQVEALDKTKPAP